jgi:WD40 repeat protein
MKNKEKKKKSSVKPIFIGFAAIIIIMIIASLRSGSGQTLEGPTGGVEKLKSCGDKLIAISRLQEVRTWDWENLSAGSESFEFKARKLTPLDTETILRIAADTDKLIAENIETGKLEKEVFINYKDENTLLTGSANGKYAVTGTYNTGLESIKFSIFDANLNLKASITANYSVQPTEMTIGNTGDKIAVTFKEAKGFLVTGEDESSKWKYENSEYPAFDKLTFSPDGKYLYVADSERFVYKFDVVDRELVRRYEISKYDTPPNNPQTITCLTVSSDGKLVSAGSSPGSRIYVWDTETGKEQKTVGTGFFCASGLGFSPDSSRLAISDLTTEGIKVVELDTAEKQNP